MLKADYKLVLEVLQAKGYVEIEVKDPRHFKEGLSRYKERARVTGTLHFQCEPAGQEARTHDPIFKLSITHLPVQLRRGRIKEQAK